MKWRFKNKNETEPGIQLDPQNTQDGRRTGGWNLQNVFKKANKAGPAASQHPKGLPPQHFRAGRDPRPNDVFVAIMGVTGSGKSSFISLLTDGDVEIGGGLESCTSKVQVYPYDMSPNQTVYLIDTPGFNDTHSTDAQILVEVTTWLSSSLCNRIRLSGLIYLHDITQNKMFGNAVKTLRTFKELSGPGAMRNVILASTHWDIVHEGTESQYEKREQELVRTKAFWAPMIAEGSRVERHFNTKASATRLINMVVPQPKVTLAVQTEMVDEHKKLSDTTAGKTLGMDIADKLREEYEEHIREIKQLTQAKEKSDAEQRRAQREYHQELARMRQQLELTTKEMTERMEWELEVRETQFRLEREQFLEERREREEADAKKARDLRREEERLRKEKERVKDASKQRRREEAERKERRRQEQEELQKREREHDAREARLQEGARQKKAPRERARQEEAHQRQARQQKIVQANNAWNSSLGVIKINGKSIPYTGGTIAVSAGGVTVNGSNGDGIFVSTGQAGSSGNHGSRSRRSRRKESGNEDCSNCRNCRRCEDCDNCTNCTNCEDCSNCQNCSDCEDCSNCTNCKNCEDCSNCTDCIDSTDCSNCVGCVGCEGCNGCVGCKYNSCRR